MVRSDWTSGSCRSKPGSLAGQKTQVFSSSEIQADYKLLPGRRCWTLPLCPTCVPCSPPRTGVNRGANTSCYLYFLKLPTLLLCSPPGVTQEWDWKDQEHWLYSFPTTNTNSNFASQDLFEDETKGVRKRPLYTKQDFEQPLLHVVRSPHMQLLKWSPK